MTGALDPTEARIVDTVRALLDRGKTRQALDRAEAEARDRPELADAHYALGLAFTRARRIEEADVAFGRAADRAPDRYFRPFRLKGDAFDRAVEEALASLPEEFARYLENVEVAVEEVPPRRLLREEELEHDLLGLYLGATIQSSEEGFPDRILLFQRNLENLSSDRETLLAEIRDTVLHEVGHHLGMEEAQLQEIEHDGEESDQDDVESR